MPERILRRSRCRGHGSIAFAVPAGLALAISTRAGTIPPPPATDVAVVRDTLHGSVLEDPYRWLEDQKVRRRASGSTRRTRTLERVMAAAPGREGIGGASSG